MLNHLRIHWKLGLLSAIFLAPITLMTWLLIDQSRSAIAFSSKELDGSGYVGALADTALPIALGAPADAARTLPALDAIERQVGAAMNLGATAARLRKLAVQGDAAAAMAALTELVVRVGDGSNLILDPDLDSYYSMSLVVLKIPRALEQTVRMASATDPLAARTHAAALALSLDELDADLAGAYRGSPDGSLRQAYAVPFAQYRARTLAYLALADTAPRAAQTADAYRASVSQARLVWKLAVAELERLLKARIAALEAKLVLSLAATAVVLGLAAFLAWLIARSISRHVVGLVGQMGAIAAGDLSRTIDSCGRRDEFGLLTITAAAMQRQLHGLTVDVRDKAGRVEAGALAMVAAVDEQAASTSQVGSTVAEITATMEQLSDTSTQIAEHARAVAEIANRTWENSKKGSEAMHVVLARMADIEAEHHNSLDEVVALGGKSRQISKVMEIIDAVADQTRLIAFNAALEASDAGDAGRRFGVVAAEIRRLADSVTDSTGAIAARINEIQDAINRLVLTSEKGAHAIGAGMQASASTARRLDELVAAVSQTSNAAEQISLSTQQQRSASGQVAQALREIANASHHNAESIGRIAQISRDMTATSCELREAVGQFKLEREA